MAAQAGIVINNAQMHERALQQKEVEQDLKLATEVQQAFLPQVAARRDRVSGSKLLSSGQPHRRRLFRLHPSCGRSGRVVVADVVGHGVAAAMFMAKLSAETRFCLASEPNVAKAIESAE